MTALTAADRLQIHELFARYYVAVDTHDPEAWLELWADDGVFDFGETDVRPLGEQDA